MKKLLGVFLLILSGWLLVGCIEVKEGDKQAIKEELEVGEVPGRISASLSQGLEVLEIDDPGFDFPEEIHRAQVEKYFRLGDLFFGLARQTSMNFNLSILYREGFEVKFVGVLVGDEESRGWNKFLQIQDSQRTDSNNPYYLWSEEGKMFLTVVDQRGAGSGEGILKLMATTDGEDWRIEDCYYFGSNYRGPEEDGDYFEFSKELALHEKKEIKECDNLSFFLVE